MVDGALDYAEVWIWGEPVGVLALDRPTWIYAFEYYKSWVELGVELAPFTMPVSTKGSKIFSFPRLNEETFKGVPGCLADSLPDDFGNAVINAWLARQGRDPATFSAVERLLYIGARGMGALEFSPAFQQKNVNVGESLELESLLRTAQQVLDERAGAGGGLVDRSEEALHSIFQVGSSAGGARPKAVVAINQDRTEIRSGQVNAPQGFEHYLLKFDGVQERASGSEIFGDPKGFGLMEYTYYQMATEFGITMAHCEILEDGPRAHFLTKRFDREGNEKIHVQTLCAMRHADYKMPGTFSYEELFMTARELRLSRDEALQIYRRMVFNVIARNQDDHTKNFAFLMRLGGGWELAPAYDVAYSYKPGSPWVAQHNMSLNGKRSEFERSDLLAVRKQIANFSESEANGVINECLDVVSTWRAKATQNQVPKRFIDEVEQHLRLDI